MIWLTDAMTERKIAINPTYVVAVFTATEGDAKDMTIVSLTNGTIPVKETELEVVTAIAGG